MRSAGKEYARALWLATPVSHGPLRCCGERGLTDDIERLKTLYQLILHMLRGVRMVVRKKRITVNGYFVGGWIQCLTRPARIHFGESSRTAILSVGAMLR